MNILDFSILITGANGGLGLVIVEGFLKRGFRNLVCQYRHSPDQLVEIFSRYNTDSSNLLIKADLINEDDIENMFNHIQSKFGDLWGIINLAGASTNGLSWKLSKTEFTNIIDSNLVSTFLVTRAFLPKMRDKNGGRLVNISSVVASLGAPGASHYGAAKSAIEGFTRSVALEVAGRGITVNCVALGYFDKGLISHVKPEIIHKIRELTPMRRLGDSDEILPLIIYLLSNESAFMTGQVLHLDGGLRL